MRPAAALLVLALIACHSSNNAQQSAQVRYEGRTLAEWWAQRHDIDAAKEAESQVAIHMIGAPAVPFLAEKAASHDLDEMIQGSVALESLCPNAIPAMEAARDRYPSAALDQAIRRVRADSADHVRFGLCTPKGESTHPDAPRSIGPG